MAKTKNVQDFSPAATRIYNAAKKGIVNRTNSSHVKRVIDSELDKHSLSKEKIQKEISDNVDKACAITVEDVKSSFEHRILEFENEVKDLQDGAEKFANEFAKTATKELKDENSVLKQQAKTLTEESSTLSKENERLVERVNGLTEQVVNLQTPTGSNQPKDDTPPNPDQEKESSQKKKR